MEKLFDLSKYQKITEDEGIKLYHWDEITKKDVSDV